MNQPVIQPIPGKDLWQLAEDFDVFVGSWYINVRAGFVTDGASIPNLPILRWWVGDAVEDDLLAPALIHDALYQSEALPRHIADRILYDLCRLNGVGWFRAQAIYRAVRIFGGVVWAKHDRQDVLSAQADVEVRTV